MFEFMIYVGTGLRGYWVKLFAKTEKDALDKAKATFSGEYYHVGSAEEIIEETARQRDLVAQEKDKEIERLRNLLDGLGDSLSAPLQSTIARRRGYAEI